MVLISLLAACGGSLSLTGEEELALSAATGPEEAMVEGSPVSAAQPEADRPDPMRECDAGGGFSRLFERYDADGDGRLGAPEEAEVQEARAFRSEEERRRVEGAWALLLAVYDDDGSCGLEEAERTTLFDDATARCDALQSKLLAEFDTDGDGALSAAEEEAARAALDARRPTGEPPEAPGAPPAGGPCAGAAPPPLSAWDTDADGYFSAEEYAAMRPEVRALLRDGEPVFGPPPAE